MVFITSSGFSLPHRSLFPHFVWAYGFLCNFANARERIVIVGFIWMRVALWPIKRCLPPICGMTIYTNYAEISLRQLIEALNKSNFQILPLLPLLVFASFSNISKGSFFYTIQKRLQIKLNIRNSHMSEWTVRNSVVFLVVVCCRLIPCPNSIYRND